MAKNLSLNSKEFEEYVVNVEEMRVHDEVGIRYIFRFSNDYGASVVKAFGSNGYEENNWEVACLLFEDESNTSYILAYPDQIVQYGCTVGNLDDEEVYKMLKMIKDL